MEILKFLQGMGFIAVALLFSSLVGFAFWLSGQSSKGDIPSFLIITHWVFAVVGTFALFFIGYNM